VFVLVLLGHQWWCAKPTPGAGDNASGVAALLLTAEAMPDSADTDVLLVATGAEEAGLYGMTHLLNEGGFDKSRDLFLNIDNVGAPPLRLISHEGILLPMAADEAMLTAAQDAAASLGLDAQVDTYRTLPVESAAALLRGYRAMSIIGSLANWHQASDTAENADASVAAQAAALAAATIELVGQFQ
jgi:Zn-dependent M28 family amino/carboxypeptidase